MNLETFVNRYPEFDRASSDLVQATLTETAARLSTEVFGARWDEAHGALTAHTLWASPFGVALRLDGDTPDGESKYWKHFEKVRKEVTVPRTFMVL